MANNKKNKSQRIWGMAVDSRGDAQNRRQQEQHKIQPNIVKLNGIDCIKWQMKQMATETSRAFSSVL